jgi:tRNA nucleotidyltransferase/poly(A) polymerase
MPGGWNRLEVQRRDEAGKQLAMPPAVPEEVRQFAVEVVRRLRQAGFEALWAGGCVRDQLMGRQPEDYDVATSAVPEQIRDVFGRRRTIAVGAAFGVITVLGSKRAGQVEVATFRRDAQYSDGRHPDRVAFSTAEQDAQRRDFTINGMFFDPLADRVIDYVGGQRDLRRRIVRAIGDPDQRFAEDKLRLIRAVRFSAALAFPIEECTRAAIVRHAREIAVVSAERMAVEMRRMLVHPNRAAAVQLLSELGLLDALLPESAGLGSIQGDDKGPSPDTPWGRTLGILRRLDRPAFPMALAALLREICSPAAASPRPAKPICLRWRLSNEETESVDRLLRDEPAVRAATGLSWPRLQRILTADLVEDLLAFSEAAAHVVDGHTRDIEYCRAKLKLPPEDLNPPPLLTGDGLKTLGVPPGPIYRTLLEQVRDAQLDKRIATVSEAIVLAKQLWRPHLAGGESDGQENQEKA